MWALVQEGIVIETTDVDPEGRYHPDLQWRACSEQVKPGWLYVHAAFSERVESEEERRAAERQWRDVELAARQWIRERHRDEQDLGRPTTLSNEQFTELLAYLQALRDWPQAEAFPDSAYRPVAPGWIAEQHL
ncbi:phage tail assembly chaperone [Pseudomonas sp. p106]|uniref:phage tail assembly chaperone n=1 Tax=Pseudomonas sp. p106 TaxID=2479854 RepID=UPI002113A31D|nr:phage tail assembly chaperone [Pseudomonas sp. p106]